VLDDNTEDNKDNNLVKLGHFLSLRNGIKNLAGLCEGLPQPKLRFMVGGATKSNISIEIKTALV
jgi:hypothetical protein